MDDAALFDEDPLEVYLYAISQVPPLGPDEEMSCIEHIRAEDLRAKSAAKRLVEAHLGLVVSIAERYRSDRINILDLIESGNAGLLQAVQALRDFHHDRFATYATPHVERALADAVHKSESTET
jgi:DNA-directed RNA polymerase sigma subunit (sigma70/sigma32)